MARRPGASRDPVRFLRRSRRLYYLAAFESCGALRRKKGSVGGAALSRPTELSLFSRTQVDVTFMERVRVLRAPGEDRKHSLQE
jgi:hypothetical protein